MAGAYNRDPALLALAAPALVLATLFFMADGIQVVAAQANRAAGDVWWPTIMHFAAYGGVMMPLGWLLAHRIGVNGLVWAVIIASLVVVDPADGAVRAGGEAACRRARRSAMRCSE